MYIFTIMGASTKRKKEGFMRNKKKTAIIFAIATVAGTVMAACGSGAAVSPGGSGAPDSSVTEAADSGDRVEISVWHYFEREQEFLDTVDAYNQSQDKVYAKVTYVSRDDLMKQYTIGAVSGELPDVGMVDSPDMASFIALGVFEDITDEIEAWGELDQFYPGPLSSCMDAEGRIYGLPNNSNSLALACNMDLLNAAGYTEPPTTWEEFAEIAAATTDPENSVYGFAMSALSSEEGTFQFIPWLYSAGGSVDNLASEESMKALDFLAGLVQNGYMSKEIVNWKQADAYQAFLAQKAAMFEAGTWHIPFFDEDIGDSFNYKVTLLPKDKEYSSVIGGENFGVCAGTEHMDACIHFMKWLQSKETIGSWCSSAGKLPPRMDSLELYDAWTSDERYVVFNEELNYAVARGPHESWPVISEAIYSAEQSVILGHSDTKTAFQSAYDTLKPIFDESPLLHQD